MVDGRHDGEGTGHGPDAAADAVEDLAHDEVADIDAWMAEIDQQCRSEDAERNTRDGGPVVATVSSQAPADERSDDCGGH